MKPNQFLQLIFVKVQLNLKSEARKSYLSYIWWILEPALFVGVFYLVFGVFFSRGTPDFLVFLLCGQIPFLWFSRTITNGSASIEQGSNLMQQIKIPKVFFPAVTIFQDFFKAICVFVLFLLFITAFGYHPNLAWISLPIVIFVQLTMIASLAILVAMFVPFVPDLKFLVTTVVQLVMFASGIFYDYKQVVLEQHHGLFLLNPMANLIEQYRRILMEGEMPDFTALMAIFAVASLVLIAELLILRKLDPHYPRVLAQ